MLPLGIVLGIVEIDRVVDYHIEGGTAMAMTDDLRIAHANAVAWRVGYPEGAEFAERHRLTVEQTHIPTARYTSPEFLAAELDRVWRRTWQMACRSEDVAQPGDYVAYTIADQEWLVVRQTDGSVKALSNACRHRGNMIKVGCGSAHELRCQYHHWCWQLDGSLHEIPDRHLFTGVDDADYALATAACAEWGGFVFVNLAGRDVPPLRDYLGAVADQLDPYHLDRMRATTSISTDLACNWKVAVEAFLEVYHVQGIHPQLMPMLDDVNTAYELIGPHSRMIVPFGVPSMRLEHVDEIEVYEAFTRGSGSTVVNRERRAAEQAGSALADGYKAAGVDADGLFDEHGQRVGDLDVRQHLIEATRAKGAELGHDYSELSRDQLIDDYHYLIFPGLVFNTHAGGFLLFRIRPHATDPDRCWFDVWRFAWPDEHGPVPAPVENRWVEQGTGTFGQVLDQDFENLPRVQRGLHSSSLRFVTLSSQEVRVAHVHAVVDDYLAR
jgi:phenylpropionate dioxygenase-like ring-hydroxylating dioxygenase large terminal subunit